ncbi:hypothetical protein KQX54_021808 [Cotesia glomerata]|uniref:Uncharacterized protein n=1 Tax=Cotesia glomerata TaxID=32391 RepID=A0AAV7J8A0_COTGL|nr:hypothetical protein KQX54_021808 [Cotesia glomerata]
MFLPTMAKGGGSFYSALFARLGRIEFANLQIGFQLPYYRVRLFRLKADGRRLQNPCEGEGKLRFLIEDSRLNKDVRIVDVIVELFKLDPLWELALF